jgi:hypothetical protein
MRRWLVAVPLTVCALALAGQAAPGTVPHWKTWLCLPGTADDWCDVDLKTTVFGPSGPPRTDDVSVSPDPPIDCFYVYPTVSTEIRPNSNLVVQPAERAVAIMQASYFSHVCRVYAPMYQQVTADAGECASPLFGGGCVPAGNQNLAYADVVAAWRDYMAHYNDGVPVVLIGHSQGSFLLKELLENVIERSPERKQVLSAILLGGDVAVDTDNKFDGIPACASTTQTSCIVAYSSWSHTPPADANFEQVGSASQHVLCVNPAAPGGGSAAIKPVFAGLNPVGIAPDPSIYTKHAFVEFPGLYTAHCVRQGTRAWLLVTRNHIPKDTRPAVRQVLAPSWGLHAADVNITLANLVTLVADETAAWLRHK